GGGEGVGCAGVEVRVAPAGRGPGGPAVSARELRRAFFVALGLSAAGVAVVAAALVGLRAGALSPLAFMVLHGLGLYLPYIVVQTTLFERLIAMTRDRGNIGYLVYLADAFGYLGAAAVLVAHTLLAGRQGMLDFFVAVSWVIAATSLLMLLPCWRYFATHEATRRAAEPAAASA